MLRITNQPLTQRREATMSPDGLAELLPRQARMRPDRIALITGEMSLTYADLDSLSNNVAHGLLARGVKPGERVAILSQNRWEWIVSYHGILKAGAVVNPLNVMLTGREVAFVLSDAQSVALLASRERLEIIGSALSDVATLRLVISFDSSAQKQSFSDMANSSTPLCFSPHPVDPDALASISYTSGTTGRPKGAMQSHRSLMLNCAYTATMHARSSDDVMVTALPAPHVYGNIAINSIFLVGGTVVLMERFTPSEALGLIDRHKATMFEGVPAMYSMMLTDKAIESDSLASLTRCTVGGQTIARTVIDAWEAHSGAPLIELWGMTELSGLGATHAVHAPNVHGSIGVALPGVDLKIVDLDDPNRECSPDEPGELLVRGPIVTMGYYNNPDASAEALTNEGWLRTGDVATRSATGHIFVVDRLKDMIVTAGYNVYPAEIERVMMSHPSVALVAIGREPDDVKGEVAHAYVVLAPGRVADTDSILAHCRAQLAAYKVPRAVHYVAALPMTSSGKVMRRNLHGLGSHG